MLSCNTLNLNDNIVYMEGYMLCYTFVDSVIWFERVYIRRVLHKIWQSIPKFATQIEKTIFVYIFVHSWKINVHWTSFSGVITMDIKVDIIRSER